MRAIMLYALSVCLLLGTAFGSLARPDPKEQVEQVEALMPVDLDTEMLWDSSCGTWNGFYWRTFNFVLLCEENLDLGVGPARFIYLHELGHALTFAIATDFSRWEDNYEAAADEFAAVMSIVQGHPEDLLSMAKVFEEEAKTRVWNPKDPHPPLLVRAQTLRDIYLGYVVRWSIQGPRTREIIQFWHSELLAWQRVKGEGHVPTT